MPSFLRGSGGVLYGETGLGDLWCHLLSSLGVHDECEEMRRLSTTRQVPGVESWNDPM